MQFKAVHYVALVLTAVVLTGGSLAGQLPQLAPYLHTAVIVAGAILGTISLVAPSALAGLPAVATPAPVPPPQVKS